jgi:hypothetical protein
MVTHKHRGRQDMKSKIFLGIEFFLLCVALPTIIIAFKFAPFMFFFLWSATAVCWFIYHRYHFQDFKRLWGWEAVTWKNLRPVLIRWVVCSVLMLAFTWWYDPGRLFFIPREKTGDYSFSAGDVSPALGAAAGIHILHIFL